MMYARTTNSKCEQKTARKRLMVVDPAKAEKVSEKESHFTFYKWTQPNPTQNFQVVKL